MSDGFLGRWSRRKEAVREGKSIEGELDASTVPTPTQEGSTGSARAGVVGASNDTTAVHPKPVESQAPLPPTLADTESLTPDADFSRFVASDVPANVKNAAMKKLFADPHFNIMDRLDTYIDDYNTPDPIPPAMLRQLASAKFLKLFDDEDEKEKVKEEQHAVGSGMEEPEGGREVVNDPPAQTVAQSGASEPALSPPEPENHADPDLRLQQDHAPGPSGPGQGTG